MSEKISKLLDIMKDLRNPETGCPWDVKQTFETIAPYTVEEAYEVSDAIDRKDMDDLKDELGDLLLQVVFHSQIADESGLFDFNDVVDSISNKMIRRHPHVFTEKTEKSSEDVKETWENIKATERNSKKENVSALDGIALSLPALLRAEKLTKRAARVNFDWPSYREVFDKIREEIEELEVELDNNAPIDRIEDELGDLLFCMANLARHLKLDPEQSLKRANNKFYNRFKAVELSFNEENLIFSEQSLEKMESRWQEIKKKINES